MGQRCHERRRLGMGARGTGQAEVGDFDFTGIGEQHVGRFHVPVDDALAVRGAETAANLLKDAEGLARCKTPAFLYDLFEIAPANIFHHEVHQIVAHVVISDGDHIRMGDIRGDDSFRFESFTNRGLAGEVVIQDLHDNGSVQALVHAAVDPRHATQGEQMVEPVAAIQRLAQVRVGQGRAHFADAPA